MSVFDDVAFAIEQASMDLPADLQTEWRNGFSEGRNLFLHAFRQKPDNQVVVQDAGEAEPVRNMSGSISFRYPQVSIAVRHSDSSVAENTCLWIFNEFYDLWLGRKYSSFKTVEKAPQMLEDDKGLSQWAFVVRLEMRP